jgi:two-component system LytT family response regulator
MKTIGALIIEDEQPARDLIRKYLEDFPEIQILNEYSDGFTGLKGINEHKPDLIFLDIQMPKLSGFELLELIDDPPLVIFTTAYDEFALKAFDLNATDYLLKPFSKIRFKKAIQKAKNKIDIAQDEKKDEIKSMIESVGEAIEFLERIVVKNGSRIDVIDVNDVLFIEAEDDYVMIHTAKGQYLKQNTLKYYEDHLRPSDFIRIHRSTIARIDQIRQINNYGKESYMVSLQCGTELKVSRSRIKELREKLNF